MFRQLNSSLSVCCSELISLLGTEIKLLLWSPGKKVSVAPTPCLQIPLSLSAGKLFNWNSHFTGVFWISQKAFSSPSPGTVQLKTGTESLLTLPWWGMVPPCSEGVGITFSSALQPAVWWECWLRNWAVVHMDGHGRRITPVPVSRACSTLREKFLQSVVVSSWAQGNNLLCAEGRVKKWINSSSGLHFPSFERVLKGWFNFWKS